MRLSFERDQLQQAIAPMRFVFRHFPLREDRSTSPQHPLAHEDAGNASLR